MFERVKRAFRRKPAPVFVGHTIRVENPALNLSPHGSTHEVRAAVAKDCPLPFIEVIKHDQTLIRLKRALLESPLFEWRGGPYAGDLMEIMDHVLKGEADEVGKFSDALRSGTDGSQLPLINATALGDAVMVDALLRAGASPHGTANLGMTALHWACGRGLERIAATLALAGADKTVPNWFTFTPIDLALMNRHERLAKKLDARVNSATAVDWIQLTADRLLS